MLKETYKRHVAAFKVTTGEEFISNVEYESEDEYLIRNPYTLVATAQGPQFAPFLMMAKDGTQVHIRKSTVIAKYDADEKLTSSYESVSSGIALPQKSGIIV